jgi:hypothetical protein
MSKTKGTSTPGQIDDLVKRLSEGGFNAATLRGVLIKRTLSRIEIRTAPLRRGQNLVQNDQMLTSLQKLAAASGKLTEFVTHLGTRQT